MKNFKSFKVICENTNTKGIIAFYIVGKNEKHFLFNQKFRQGSYEFYKNGVRYEKAVDYASAKKDHSIINVMRRISPAVKYLISYEGLYVPSCGVR